MAIGIHFDDDDIIEYDDTLGIGMGHRDEKDEESDSATMGIGIGHREEKGD
jgi:hypothetical protein